MAEKLDFSNIKGKLYKLDSGIESVFDQSIADLNIGDERGNSIAQVKGGHIKTKEFNSLKSANADSDNSDAELNIGDDAGNVLLQVKNGHIKTKNFDSENIDVDAFLAKDTLAKIYVTSPLITVDVANNTLLPLTVEKNKVNCQFKYVSTEVSFKDTGSIAYQGNSTLEDPKKGFRFNFNSKHRIKNMIPMKKFNCKAYYGDWMHVFEHMGNDIIEQMYLSREQGKIRPYMLNNDFASDKLEMLMDVGASCHIEGVPCELYINDSYWGIYSLNYKKDEDIYCINKNDYNHIQVEATNDWQSGSWVVTSYVPASFADGATGWRCVEFRDPDGLLDVNLDEYDGDKPLELLGTTSAGYDPNNPDHVAIAGVKQAWRDFITALNSITASTTVAELRRFLNVEDWVDNLLFTWLTCNLDCYAKNTLYTTWDGGEHWSPLLYDLNNTWGIHWGNIPGVSYRVEINLPVNQDPIAYVYLSKLPWINTLQTVLATELRTRYAQLRRDGIFSVKNIQNMLNGYTNQIGEAAYKRDITRWNYPGGIPYYDSVKMMNWVTQRIAFLDTKYGYSE